MSDNAKPTKAGEPTKSDIKEVREDVESILNALGKGLFDTAVSEIAKARAKRKAEAAANKKDAE